MSLACSSLFLVALFDVLFNLEIIMSIALITRNLIHQGRRIDLVLALISGANSAELPILCNRSNCLTSSTLRDWPIPLVLSPVCTNCCSVFCIFSNRK